MAFVKAVAGKVFPVFKDSGGNVFGHAIFLSAIAELVFVLGNGIGVLL
ncbi:hypothetical protein SDC9_118070 [bioreactor metagenome]|uniref:Uncharacterized protein n=1 Tax=bioreactor metagenome TaxID=1076179 RepID=A0A645C1A7_9ZZZZ